MAVTIATLSDKVRREIPADKRSLVSDYESLIPEALKAVSHKVANPQHEYAIFRPSLETIVNLTLGVRDGLNRQTAALPVSSTVIIPESIRDGDVTHTDLTDPLIMRAITELTYVFSASVLGFFSVDDGKVYAFKQGTAFATTASALKARGVLLMQAVADIPLVLEDAVVDTMIQMVMQPMGATA